MLVVIIFGGINRNCLLNFNGTDLFDANLNIY